MIIYKDFYTTTKHSDIICVIHNSIFNFIRFAYGTTKAAVIGLTKSLAADLVGRKVVNIIMVFLIILI